MVRSGVLNVYIKDISPRASWIFKLIFEELLSCQLRLTNDIASVRNSDGQVLNYSDDEIPGIPWIIPHGLLSEKEVREQQIEINEFQGLKVFFSTEGKGMPFDPFAMAFYLVSRYEEHLPFEQDRHGRFPATASLAYREGFLQVAVVNRLAMMLRDLILAYYPDTRFKDQAYQFLPSIDVDIAYAHLGKGFIRTYGAMLKLLMKGDLKEIKDRFLSMSGKAKDPFDNFDFIQDACKEKDLHPIFFILAGDPGPYDRNLSTGNEKFARLLKDLSIRAEIGVHPSYGSNNDPDKLRKELAKLQAVIGKKIEKSRQHFVRLSFPETYRMLISNKLTEDYSMGYADNLGFRASIASPYTYFDLTNDVETSLKVFPFMLMDSTMSDYLGLDPEQYIEHAQPIIEEVKNCGGTLIAIWHNYAMANNNQKLQSFKDLLTLAASK